VRQGAAGGHRPPVSTWREALSLSWPATLLLLLHAGYRVVDQYWVQGLGAEAQAALGVTSFHLILNFAFITSLTTGVLARVARFTGAGDRPALERTVAAAYGSGLLWFLGLGLLGYANASWLVGLGGARDEVAALARDYLRTIYLVLPGIAFKPLTDALFIGRGDTRTPMLLSGLSLVLNCLLNPVLIYGRLGAPALGVAGAALATGLARGTAAILGMLLLARRDGLRPRIRNALDPATVGPMFRIGAPMGLSTAGYAITFLGVLKLTIEPFHTSYGPAVQAGFGVAFNGVEALSYCALMGPAVAVSSMVGRRLGAGDLAGARAAVRACLWMSCGLAALASALFLGAPHFLASAYTDDAAVLEQAGLYLWVVGWTQVVTAAQSVLEQALAGAGRTFLMSLTTLTGNLLRIPLAWWMAWPLGLGPAGAWWALNLSNLFKLAAIILVFRAGGWRRAGSPRAAPTA